MTTTNDSEVLDDVPHPPSDIQEGTVGWVGSPEVCELGSEAGDGVTLVRVTLHTGHTPGEPTTDDGLANGLRKTCRLGGVVSRIPKRGESVIVAFPDGDWGDARGVIIATINVGPSRRFGRRKTVLDFGADDVVLTARSIALVVESTADGATARYSLSLDGQGGLQALADGSGLFLKDGQVCLKTVNAQGDLMTAVTLTQDEIGLYEGSTLNQSTLSMSGGDVTMVGQFINIVPKTTLMFGQAASPATPMLVGPAGPTGVPSLFIFAAINP